MKTIETVVTTVVQKTDRYTKPSQVLFRYLGNMATVMAAASPACHAEAKVYVAAKVDARATKADADKALKVAKAAADKALEAAKLEADKLEADKQKAAKLARQRRVAALRLGAIIAHA